MTIIFDPLGAVYMGKIIHQSKTSHLSEISPGWCISLCKNKSFIWEWIHHTQVRSDLNIGSSHLGEIDFLHVNGFFLSVPPKQDC